MSDRLDTTIEFNDTSIEVTGKCMENGETRLRVRFPSRSEYGVTATFTAATQDGWQEPHYHGGVTETYTVTRGTVTIVCVEDGEVVTRTLGVGEACTVSPRVEHNVHVSADAEFLTTVTGVAVGNPDRKGNDWFPVADDSPLRTLM